MFFAFLSAPFAVNFGAAPINRKGRREERKVKQDITA
jgi:hypothetical protein